MAARGGRSGFMALTLAADCHSAADLECADHREPLHWRVIRKPMNAPIDVSFFARAAKPLTSYRKYWAARFGTAKFLPMSRAEMDVLGWDSCDIIVVTGDA